MLILMVAVPTAASAEGWLVGLSEDAVITCSDELEYVADGIYKTDEQTAQSLIGADGVTFVEEDVLAELYDAPNDTYYSSQLSLINFGYEDLYSTGLNGSGVNVAVIDSGAAEHTDIGDRLLDGYDVTGEGDENLDDVGHGSMCAGIIAAETNNGMGLASIAGGCNIIPIKAFTSKSSYISTIISAISYAINNYDIDVINMSFGFSDNSTAFRQVMNTAYSKGIILVAAAGNNTATTVKYPAGYSNVIGVNSVGDTKSVSSFSQINSGVNISAPGEGIYGFSTDGGYKSGNGTSYAAPFVTAMAAVAKEYNPDITPSEFLALLKSTSDDAGDEGYDTQYGWGIVNLSNFAEAIVPSSIVTVEIEDSRALIDAQSAGGIYDVYAAYYKNDILQMVEEISGQSVQTDVSDYDCLKLFVWDEMIPIEMHTVDLTEDG